MLQKEVKPDGLNWWFPTQAGGCEAPSEVQPWRSEPFKRFGLLEEPQLVAFKHHLHSAGQLLSAPNESFQHHQGSVSKVSSFYSFYSAF